MAQRQVPAQDRKEAINYDALNRALEELAASRATFKPIEIPEFPPGVKPSEKGMAMDDTFGGSIVGPFSWGAEAIASLVAEGEAFLGYGVLAEMALRPEYRQICATVAEEMVRKWIDFGSKGGGEKSPKIADIKDEIERLEVRENFRKIAEQDGFFGRAHLYLDTGDGDNPEELEKPIGSGRDDTSKSKIKTGSFKRLKTVEAVWTYPLSYNANDPLAVDWYQPQLWQVYGKRIHRSRILTFVSHPVPDILKPAFAFGGLARTQLARPYVQNWLRTRQSVSDLVHSFSVWILLTDLVVAGASGAAKFFERVKKFIGLRDNKGLAIVNKDTEAIENRSVPLAGLPELLAKSQEQICGVSRIPVVKYLGIQPSGLNASSEGELTVWYDYILSQQESFFRPHLQTIIDFIQLSKWGEIDEDIIFNFEPLEEMNLLEKANIEKAKADTDQVLIDAGVLDPRECRERLASDPESEYAAIDVEDVPEPLGMGEFGEGLEQGLPNGGGKEERKNPSPFAS